jgi:hypothetical protein
MKKLDCPVLPPDSFHVYRAAVYLGVSTDDIYDWKDRCFKKEFNLIGKIDATNLTVRPKPNGIAVLVEENETGDRIWFHLPGWVLDE